MNNVQKSQLTNLYVQKGELITEMEAMERQLQAVNQRINQIRNAIMQQPQTQKADDKKSSSNKKDKKE